MSRDHLCPGSAWRPLPLAALLVIAAAGGCSELFGDDSADPAAAQARLEAQGSDTTADLHRSALQGTTAKRTRTAAAMLFDIGSPPNKTAVTNLLNGPGISLTRMYNEVSFGLQQVQVDIFGPYTLPVKNCLTIACCGPSSDRTGNGATVQSLIDALPMKYDHYFWDYGAPLPSGANCGTWGDEGSPTNPAKYSSYSFQGIVGQAQELGHNLGMTHEPTLSCTGGKTFLDDTTQCTHNEYGSSLSFMGGGAHHPSAYHKFAQGWIGKCNVVSVGTSGTFNLVPQEQACDGAQLLKIAAPKTRAAPAKGDRQNSGNMLSNYYLEMRAPIGFDSGLKPMVVVSIGAGLPTATMAAPYVYVLDMVPESGRADLSNAGLLSVGQNYRDPVGGLTITLTAINAQGATVEVTTTATGANTCADGTTFTAPGPDHTSCSMVTGGDGGVVTGTGGATGGTGGRAGTGGRPDGGNGGTTGSAGVSGTGASGGTSMGTGGGSGGAAGTTGGSASGSGGRIAVGGGGSTSTSDASIPTGTGGQGTPATGTGNETGGGCGCNTAPSSGIGGALLSSGGGGLFFAAGFLLLRRRRSRRVRS